MLKHDAEIKRSMREAGYGEQLAVHGQRNLGAYHLMIMQAKCLDPATKAW